MEIKHDFHIHTDLSICANETATLGNYVEIANKLGLEKIGIANHFWDSRIEGAFDFYKTQDFEHISKLKPELEKVNVEGLRIYFGAEAEYDFKNRDVSVTEEVAEQLDFLIVPNSHTHITMPGEFYEPYGKHIEYMINAYEDIINSKVSKYITAVAHPFCAVCCPYDREILINMITDDTFRRLFDKTANKGIAFELNVDYMEKFKKTEEEIRCGAHMRMFRLAKECGCKFIFGSDAHSTKEHESYKKLTKIFADELELKEENIAEIVL